MAASTEAPSKRSVVTPTASGEPSSVERRGGRVEVGAGAGEHRDAGAVRGEAVGGGSAHAGGAAGDDDGGSGES